MKGKHIETVTEQVDIGLEAEEQPLYSPGSLEELDESQRITVHWFKEKMIAWVSLLVIVSLLFLSIYLVIFGPDADAKDWGKQIATTLLGFAAGAIWQVQKK